MPVSNNPFNNEWKEYVYDQVAEDDFLKCRILYSHLYDYGPNWVKSYVTRKYTNVHTLGGAWRPYFAAEDIAIKSANENPTPQSVCLSQVKQSNEQKKIDRLKESGEEKKSSESKGGSTFCQVLPGTQILHCW